MTSRQRSYTRVNDLTDRVRQKIELVGGPTDGEPVLGDGDGVSPQLTGLPE